MSLKFRQAFKQTLFTAKCCKRQIQKTRTKAYFSYRFSRRNGYSETSFTSVEAGAGSPARSIHSHHSEHSPESACLREVGKAGRPLLHTHHSEHSPDIARTRDVGKTGRVLLNHSDMERKATDHELRQFVVDINKDSTIVDANRNKAVDHVKLSDIPEVINECQTEVT